MAEPKTNLRVAIGGDLAEIKSALVGLNSRLDQTGKAGAKAGADASKGLSGIGSAAGSLRGKLAGLFAGLTVGALFKGILDNTRESEAAIAQLNAGLKSTGGIAGVTAGDISTLADSLAGVTTYGDDAIVSMASILATFTNVRTTIFKDAIPAILDLSTRLKIDLDGAAKLVGKSLNDPIKGMTALAKVGVQFSEAQKKVIEDMVKTGDVAGAQRIILDQLAKVMGGSAAAAADTLAGSVAQAQNAFGNLLEGDSSSGGLKDVKTAFQDLTKTLNDPQVKEGFQTIIQGIASMVVYAAEAIGTFNKLRIAIIDALSANGTKSYDGLLTRLEQLKGREALLADGILNVGMNRALYNASLAGLGPTIEEVRAEMREVQKLLDENQGILQGRFDARGATVGRRSGTNTENNRVRIAPLQGAPIIDEDALARAAADAKRKLEALRKEREKLLEESKKADAERVKDLLELEAKISAGMADVEIALKRATGDEAGAAFDEIEQKYAQLIADLKASGRAGSVEIVERLINLEKVDAQLAQFKTKMQEASAASQATIGSLSGQAAGGLISGTEADQGRGAALERELAIQQQLLATARAYLATLAADSPEAAKTLAFIEQLNGHIGEVQATQSQFAQGIKDQAVQSLTTFFTDLATGAKSFKDAFLDMVRSFVAGVIQMIAQKLALKAVDALFSLGSGGGSFGIPLPGSGLLPGFHTGGVVGAGAAMMRRVSISPFLRGEAPRYHRGGIAGLEPNEIGAVLQRGEEVLTRNDPRHRYNGGGASATPMRNKTVILFDANSVAEHMVTSVGEKAILHVVGRNAGAVRQLLG